MRILLPPILIFCMPTHAATSSEQYALSERCGKSAAEWFKEHWGTGQNQIDGETVLARFVNHYNVKLNKCFVLVSIHFNVFADSSRTRSNRFELIDLHE